MAVLQLTVFNSNPTEAEYAAAQAGLSSPSASPQASNSADVPAADTAAGKTFTGELALNGGVLGVRIDGTTAPQAAAVIKSLSDSGYYDGTFCHRLTTSETFGLLQCGAKSEDGADDANYRWGPLENTPSNNTYPAGTIAVARTGNNAYGNGHQFFIVYKDTTIPADSAGGYTVVGKVTSGPGCRVQDRRGGAEGRRHQQRRRPCGTCHDRLVFTEVTNSGPRPACIT